jgi:hypothetical protein
MIEAKPENLIGDRIPDTDDVVAATMLIQSFTTRNLCIAASRYLTVNGLKMAISIA